MNRSGRHSRVPTSRLERLGHFGWLAGELAVSAVAEGVRRVAGMAPTHGLLASEANAQRLARRLASLRGAAMKVGQMLSLQGEALLAPELTQALGTLRAGADSMPPTQLRRVLARAYGAGWERRFREFDFTPVASASIGQVHRARAADGRLMALKIQYPGIVRSIDSDVQNVTTVLRLARLLPGELDLSAILAEAKCQLRRETDYDIEAGFQRRYRTLVADQPEIVVPRVYDDFTTTHILAMDFIEGISLEDLDPRTTSQRVRDELGTRLFRLVMRELFEFHFLQSDPNFANYIYVPATGQLGLLDFGGCRGVPAALARGYARLLRAGLEQDRPALRTVIHEIGFCAPDETDARVDELVRLFLIGCEPFRHHGPYDCAESTMPARARDVGFNLALGKGFLRPPPPDTLFLHRKLAGTFLLCARLRARVDMRALLLRALEV